MQKEMKNNFSLQKILASILVLMWMITVFIFSSQDGIDTLNTSGAVISVIESKTTNDSSNVVSDNLGKTDNKNSLENKKYKYTYSNKIQKLVRKNAHYFLYMLGGVFLSVFFCANSKYKSSQIRFAIYAIITGIVYAFTDEFHQRFVPGRTGSLKNVFIDSMGVITGVVLLYILRIILKRNVRIKWGSKNVTVK